MKRKRTTTAGALTVLVLLGSNLAAQQVPVEELVLDNGMTILLVPRKGDPNVAAGWVAKVGSVNERPGITGISHLFEHMMFKGTRAIGTTNVDEELATLARLDEVKAQIRTEERELQRRARLGDVGDLTDPKNRTPRHQALLTEFAALQKREQSFIVKNEFDRIYTTAGASSMNAGTTEDFTIYFINVPSNKLELWFWMESDRLANPVFREFYAERDVVREERRLRTESTPTGKFDEQFNALFWNSSPYHWPVVGWPSDVEAITREEAEGYFALNYAPNNLTACLVGDFDAEQAKTMARRYFGRLPRNPQPPPPVRTQEVEPLAERRMVAYAETEPQVDVRYLSVADGHRDEPALVVLGALLSGRTGRLYKSLVLEQKVANGAAAGQNGLKWAGYFALSGVARQGRTPEEVEAALYGEIEKLQQQPVPERELEKVKNRFAAGEFRRLRSNFALMLQLLVADVNRGWRTFFEDPKTLASVTPADVQRVANAYFKPERRAVITYYTKKSDAGGPTDPLLEGLSPQEQAQVRQMRSMLEKASVEQAREMLGRLEQQAAAAPPEKQKLIGAMKRVLEQRIEKGGQQ